QFIVVERQQLHGLLEEKKRVGSGRVQMDPGDPAALALLEKLDATILGKVTLLRVPTEVKPAQKPTEAQAPAPAFEGGSNGEGAPRPQVQGDRIEVDAKLISRFDGRIIAAAQRSGPVACLRSIVERLGIALEQEFLRPYYGQIRFVLKDPEYVRVFLTPILVSDALDEEKPPIELSSTVT